MLKSKETLEAIKFIKALFEETMTEDVITWGTTANNRAMVAGEISLTLNSITIVRAGESKQIPITDKIGLARTPQGPVAALAPWNNMDSFVIWKFAQNIDLAKQFAVDMIGASRDAFLASKFGATLSFPDTTPDLKRLLTNNPSANPSDKYKVLANAANWSTNVGYPGYYNAAIDELYSVGLIPKMFSRAATGKMTPEESLTQADQEVRKIFDKWRALGKV